MKYLVLHAAADPEVHDSLDDIELMPDDDCLAFSYRADGTWVMHDRIAGETDLGRGQFLVIPEETGIFGAKVVKRRPKNWDELEAVFSWYQNALFAQHFEDEDDDDAVPEAE